jgi:general secretion pathway protein A
MYPTHWGLRDSPFRGDLNPETFYRSATHEEALARLHFLVDHQRRLGLLVGPPGSGKSLLLKVFARQLCRRPAAVAKLSLLDVEATEMLCLLAGEWGLNPAPAQSAATLWRSLCDRLIEYRYQQVEAVILLDDADQAGRDVLLHLGRLARFDFTPEMRLTIILAGRNQITASLGEPLLGLIDLRIALEPWEPSDTADFVRQRLSLSGRNTPLFDQPAMNRLHELTGGIPRRVCRLADLALLAGAGANLQKIDAGVVETVYQELGAGV